MSSKLSNSSRRSLCKSRFLFKPATEVQEEDQAQEVLEVPKKPGSSLDTADFLETSSTNSESPPCGNRSLIDSIKSDFEKKAIIPEIKTSSKKQLTTADFELASPWLLTWDHSHQPRHTSTNRLFL